MSTNRVAKKKTTVDLSMENHDKMKKAIEDSGKTMTQNEFINNAIAGIPIIVLGDGKLLANSFFDIRKLMEDKTDLQTIKEEVNELCQLLFLLMEEIQKNQQ